MISCDDMLRLAKRDRPGNKSAHSLDSFVHLHTNNLSKGRGEIKNACKQVNRKSHSIWCV